MTSTSKYVLNDISKALQSLENYQKYNKLRFIYPDAGPSRRELYRGHVSFFRAGRNHRFRMLCGGNGTGKSFAGATEVTYHVTGLYPEWWEGKRLKKPNTVWIVAENNFLWRDSLQKLLFGNPGEDLGTGLIPKECIIETKAIPGVPGAIGAALIKHVDGQVVSLVLKTFEMDRKALQAANIDLVAFDEEPPEAVYTECIMRLRGNANKEPGISMLLFTPLQGLSPVVLKYLPNGLFPENGEILDEPEKYVERLTWDDCPHLSGPDKEAMINEIPVHERDARTKGIPALGSGRVYPVYEEDIIVRYLKIQPHWPRAYGLDFGWNITAAVWGAKDPDTGIIYLYGEYYGRKSAPYIHTNAIKQRGAKLTGAPDPSGGGVSNKDGTKLIEEYRSLGLNLCSESIVDNSIAAGVARIYNLMESGLLKVTYNLENWLNEFRTYRYDVKNPNKIARNQADHLMDATKYLISCFDRIAISPQEIDEEEKRTNVLNDDFDADRNPITGY